MVTNRVKGFVIPAYAGIQGKIRKYHAESLKKTRRMDGVGIARYRNLPFALSLSKGSDRRSIPRIHYFACLTTHYFFRDLTQRTQSRRAKNNGSSP
jgi:hypothetical protein